MTRVVLTLGVLLSALASADEVADKALSLNKEGTTLAEQGRFDDAIARFKAAEVLLPRYQHHCNIGIAYQDSNRLPQAYRFLQSCVARAGKNASAAVKARLASVEASLKGPTWAVLVVKGSAVRVSLAPAFDEPWVVDGQRRFPLAPGPVDLSIASLSGATWTRRVDVTAGQETVVDVGTGSVPLLPPASEPQGQTPVSEPPPVVVEPGAVPPPVRVVEPPLPSPAPVLEQRVATPRKGLLPWVLAGSGVALAGVGLGTYVAARALGGSLQAGDDLTGYRALVVTTYAAWALGGAAVASALVLWLWPQPAPVSLVPAPLAGGWGLSLAGAW